MDLEKVVKIQKNFEKICDDLDVLDIRPILIEKGVLSLCDFESIDQENTRRDRAYTLLSLLLHTSTNAYDVLKDSLKQDYPWLSTGLEETTVSTQEIDMQREKLQQNLPFMDPHYSRRIHEENAIIQSLQNNSSVVTLTGVGGSGKSSIATAVGYRLVQENYRVLFASLRNVTDFRAVPNIILEQLLPTMFSATKSLSSDTTNQLCTLLNHVRYKVLIILDNAEDVLSLVEFWNFLIMLSKHKGVKCLVTSREQLHSISVGVEDIHIGGMCEDDSVQLLHRFVQDVSNNDATRIANVCGGSPLALRLIAALLARGLPVDLVLSDLQCTILERVSARSLGAVSPQEKLYHCINTSYNRLTSDEQTVFRRLGVFPRSFDIAAASCVTDSPDVECILSSLVSRSMCTVHDATKRRYLLHPVLKYFACTEMKKEEIQEYKSIETRFLVHFLQQTENLSKQYYSSQSLVAIKSIRRERENVEIMLDIICKDKQILQKSCCLHSLMTLLFLTRMLGFEKMKSFCTSALCCLPINERHHYLATLAFIEDQSGKEPDPSRTAADVQESYGRSFEDNSADDTDVTFTLYRCFYIWTLFFAGQQDKAKEVLQSLCIQEVKDNMTIEEKYLVAVSHGSIGVIHHGLSHFHQALIYYRKEKAILDGLGIKAHSEYLLVTTNIATVLLACGDISEAEDLVEECEKICNECDWQTSEYMAFTLSTKAVCSLFKREFTNAEKLAEESLRIIKEAGLKCTVYHSNSLVVLGGVYVQNQKHEEALQLFKIATDVGMRNGKPTELAQLFDLIGSSFEFGGKLQEAQKFYTDAVSVKESINDTEGMQRSLNAFIRVQTALQRLCIRRPIQQLSTESSTGANVERELEPDALCQTKEARKATPTNDSKHANIKPEPCDEKEENIYQKQKQSEIQNYEGIKMTSSKNEAGCCVLL